jgi:transposase
VRVSGVLAASVNQLDSTNWCAAPAVVLQRCDGRPERLARSRPEKAV